jgi:hypothetical protein
VTRHHQTSRSLPDCSLIALNRIYGDATSAFAGTSSSLRSRAVHSAKSASLQDATRCWNAAPLTRIAASIRRRPSAVNDKTVLRRSEASIDVATSPKRTSSRARRLAALRSMPMAWATALGLAGPKALSQTHHHLQRSENIQVRPPDREFLRTRQSALNGCVPTIAGLNSNGSGVVAFSTAAD